MMGTFTGYLEDVLRDIPAPHADREPIMAESADERRSLKTEDPTQQRLARPGERGDVVKRRRESVKHLVRDRRRHVGVGQFAGGRQRGWTTNMARGCTTMRTRIRDGTVQSVAEFAFRRFGAWRMLPPAGWSALPFLVVGRADGAGNVVAHRWFWVSYDGLTPEVLPKFRPMAGI